MTCRFAYRRYRLPFKAPVRTAHGPWTTREGVLLRLEAEDGKIGWGEAAPVPGFGTETVDEIEAACRSLGERLESDSKIAGPTCFRNALAAAQEYLHEESGKPSEALPVAALLPAGHAALAAVVPRLEAGFRTFKWKVGVGDQGDEMALLDDLSAKLPEGARLRLDANGAWDRRRAERWLEICADRPVEFVEQPAPRGNDDLLRGLAADFPTPIALDESLAGDGDIARWLDSGWPGVFVVKPALIAEVAGALARLSAARSAVVFSSALETAVGARAALRSAFAWAGPPRALGFGVWPLFADARFDGPSAAPFLRWEDVRRIDPEAAWNAAN